MFLLEGHKAPDHATLARFRSLHFAPCSKRILAEVSNMLFDLGEISGETIFIDGTKIEACANKYTFVWRKAVTKNQAKLLIKLAGFVAECEEAYDIKIVYGNTIKMKHVKRLRKRLLKLCKEENITFVHGIGRRKSPLQKSYETLDEYLNKLKEYNNNCIKINGYISDLNHYSSNNENIYIIVNNKPIKLLWIQKLIIESYNSFLLKNKYPFLILYIYIPIEFIDLNATPYKNIIKFENEE